MPLDEKIAQNGGYLDSVIFKKINQNWINVTFIKLLSL